MQKLIAVQGDYKIIQSRTGDFVIINTKGHYSNHSHYKKLSTCYLVIRIMGKRQIPRSPYLLESVIRLTLDPMYMDRLMDAYNRQIGRKKKPYYININKGVKRKYGGKYKA